MESDEDEREEDDQSPMEHAEKEPKSDDAAAKKYLNRVNSSWLLTFIYLFFILLIFPSKIITVEDSLWKL